MYINRVLNYYFHAYNKAAVGKEAARSTINIFKKVIDADNHPDLYERLKKIALNITCGPFYWPNTFPSGIDEGTALLLYNLVKLTKPEVVLEIGTAKGNAAIAMGQALKDNGRGKLYTIDPIEQELVKIAIRKARLRNHIEYLIDYSTNIIPRLNLPKIDFAFIDGDHSFESCLADFNIVKPYLCDDSILVFHDSILFSESVGEVIQLIKNSEKFTCTTLPTLSGANQQGVPLLNNINNSNNFIPAGLTICGKLSVPPFSFRRAEAVVNVDNKEFQKGERLYVGYQPIKWMVQEHLDRYVFAKRYLEQNFIVLDAACGSGYGSKILSDIVRKVIGLEISSHAIQYAKQHCQQKNIEFLIGDLNKKIQFPDNFFDAVVSFETLEHIKNQTNMVLEFQRILKPGGLLIISTPDREIISEKAGTINKFHIKELSKKEFLALISRYFTLQSLSGQIKYKPPSIWKKVVKIIIKLDVFRVRHWLERKFNLRNFINKVFSPSLFTGIEQTAVDEENEYFNLIAVAKKQSSR